MSTPINETDLAALAKLVDKLRGLDGIDSDDHYYVTGQIRVWNTNGWSPGYFDIDDDFPLFYPDYKEVEL